MSKIKVDALGKEWEVNTVSRAERRNYHGWNNQVFSDSLFKMEDEEAKLFKIITDWRERNLLFSNVLEHAFGGRNKAGEILDGKGGLTDNEQDKLAETILHAYLKLDVKKNGD